MSETSRQLSNPWLYFFKESRNRDYECYLPKKLKTTLFKWPEPHLLCTQPFFLPDSMLLTRSSMAPSPCITISSQHGNFYIFHSIWFNTLIVIGWELTFRRHHVQCFMYTVSLIYISTKYICIWVTKHFPFKIQNPLKELSLYHPVKLSCSCKSSFARGGGGEIENRKPILDHNLWLSVGQEAALGRTPQRRTQDELRSEHLEWAILNERGVQKAGKCLKELVFHFS